MRSRWRPIAVVVLVVAAERVIAAEGDLAAVEEREERLGVVVR